MFSLFKTSKISESSYESFARECFTRRNLFVNCLLDAIEFSSSKERISNSIKLIEKDPTHSDWFYLHAIRSNREVFTLDKDTVEYAKVLFRTSYLIGKCRDIFYSESSKLKQPSEYLLSILVDVVYLMQEVDESLRKGVPLDNEAVKEAVFTIHQLLEEKLNEYYQLNTENLTREIKIATTLRAEYQARKNIMNPENVTLEKNQI